MTILTILKIITRSWWRNKVFFFISIVSLAIGLACTNLLFTYYVHDYNIESGNRDKNRIFCLRQDNPMQDGSKVAYADANIPPMLKEKYDRNDLRPNKYFDVADRSGRLPAYQFSGSTIL